MAIVVALAYFLSIKSSIVFMNATLKERRRWLVLYPLLLYFLFFSFYILLDV